MSTFQHLPRHIDVAIGYNPSVSGPGAPSPDPTTDPTFQAGWQANQPWREPVLVLIENYGAAAFTAAFKQSNDNGVTDAYAAINMRNNGASVASVSVVPGGKVVVEIETFTKICLQLNVTPVTPGVSTPFGYACLTYFFGMMERLERPGIF